jgi:hypothetical protein
MISEHTAPAVHTPSVQELQTDGWRIHDEQSECSPIRLEREARYCGRLTRRSSPWMFCCAASAVWIR